MSNLLSDAIVDAKALREAALKSAETAVIEKYSNEVKRTLDHLLEQDDLDLELGGEMETPDFEAPAIDPTMEMEPSAGPEGPGEPIDEEDNIPLSATDDFSNLEGENLKDFPATGEPVELTLDLGALQEAIEKLQDTEEVDIDINEEEIIAALRETPTGDSESEIEELEEAATDPGSFAGEEAEEEEGQGEGGAAALASSAAAEEADVDAMKGLAEEDTLDELVDAIAEKLTVDMGATLSGWAGRSSESQKWEMEKALAHRRSTDVEEELKNLKKAHEELVFENNQISERHTQYKQVVEELKENLQDVNLSNARLLYTNRALRNSSLNERQKDKIVEAISRAGSVTEAKMIHETLQSTVEAISKSGPQSLSETIRSRSSVIRATRQESTSVDPLQDRMQRLAGIK
jgi:hypothetical protein